MPVDIYCVNGCQRGGWSANINEVGWNRNHYHPMTLTHHPASSRCSLVHFYRFRTQSVYDYGDFEPMYGKRMLCTDD